MRLLNGLLNLLFVITFKLVLKFFLGESVTHCKTVVLQTVLCFNLRFVLLVLCTILLCLLHHAIDLRLRQAALLVGDGDLVRLACRLVLRRHVENAISVNIESHLYLWYSSRRRRNAVQMKFTQQVVVFRHGSFTFEDLNEHARLVIRVGGECLTLFGRDGGVTLDKLSHDSSSSFQAHGQGCYIQKKQILHLGRPFASENCRLHCSAVRDSFIRINGPTRLLAVEELLQHGLHLRDTRRSSHEDHLVNVLLVDSTVTHALLNWTHGIAEVVHVQLFKAST